MKSASISRRVIAPVGAFLASFVVVAVVSLNARDGRTPDSVATSVAAVHRETNQSLPGIDRPLEAIFDPSVPLMDPGEQTSLDAAAQSIPYDFAVPQDKSLVAPEVWVSEDRTEVGLRYGSDLVLLYAPWPEGLKPAYEEQAKEWGAGYVTEIGGRTAWVVPQDAQAKGFPSVNVIHVTVDGVEVVLFSTLALDEEISIARSLA